MDDGINLIGYDIDGVISLGICPRPKNSVIITGRSYEESHETLVLMKEHEIACPIYFAPWKYLVKSRERSGQWKAEMIMRLGVDRFFEDDLIQIEEIKKSRSNEDSKRIPQKPLHIVHVQHNIESIL